MSTRTPEPSTRARALHPRPDAELKATARARFTQDLYRPGMLHGVVVRSPHAAAAIVGVDLAGARAMPGVISVLGPDDVLERSFGMIEDHEPVLARDVVRYVGEPVALVAAETRAEALAAAAEVNVDFEERPAAVYLADALADGAPQVHSGASNIHGEPSLISRGDAEAEFERAEHVVETTISSQRVHQGYIELRTALAELDSEGRLLVTMCSQAPFQVRQTLAHVFELPMTQVLVRVPAFGGGFGGKLHNGMAPYAAALALATRRPVQVVSSREEELQASNPREGSTVTLESAIDSEGRIQARRAQIHLDSGAYTYDTPFITAMGAMQAAGPYTTEAVEASAYAVRTNTHPTGSFRAPSGPQMCFANEVHIADIAARLDLDPVELRRRNLMRPGDLGPTGQEIEHPAMDRCLDEVEAVLEGWRAEAEAPADPALKRGYGLACAWWFTAPGFSAASLRLEEDGTVTLVTGATEIGTGAVVSGLVELVSEELGLEPSEVRVSSGSTDSAPPDFGSEGSRTLYGAGNAVIEAAGVVRRIVSEHAAEELEASPADLVFADGRVQVAGSPNVSISLAEAGRGAAMASGPVVGTGRFQAPATEHIESCATGMLIPNFNEPTFHCHGAEIDVDVELGHLRVQRYVAAHDVGRVVSWSGVKGQIEGGIVQGLGQALFEEVQIDERGATRNADLVDYRLPTIADIPAEIVVIAVEDFPSATGPGGAKGIGEAPVILPAAAVAAALRDATGVRITDLPLGSERISELTQNGARA